jgi:hypothetical protein
MIRRLAICTAAWSLAFSAVPASAAPAADALCPTATTPLIKWQDTAKTNPDDPQAVLDAAKPVEDAYHACAAVAVGKGSLEPEAHYDQVREAQFGVVVGRMLIIMNRIEEARAEAENARKLTQEIVDWTPTAMTYTNSNLPGGSHSERQAGTQTSNYHDTAVEILAAATRELKLIGPPPSPAPTPK